MMNTCATYVDSGSLREKCPNTELFLVLSALYSVRIQENTDQKNSVFGHFSRSGSVGVFNVRGDYFASSNPDGCTLLINNTA